jgi:hypothetical protein
MRFLVLIAAALPIAALGDDTTTRSGLSCANPAKLENHKGPIPGDYVFPKKDSALTSSAFTEKYGLTVTGVVFRHGLQGFAVPSLSASDLAKLRCDPDVELITTAGGS